MGLRADEKRRKNDPITAHVSVRDGEPYIRLSDYTELQQEIERLTERAENAEATLTAVREQVKKWREQALEAHRDAGRPTHQSHAFDACADDLDQLLAPTGEGE